MIVAITGDRNWEDSRYALIRSKLALLDPKRDFVVLGDDGIQRPKKPPKVGVDALAERACKELGLRHRVHYADWERCGRAAGPLRNRVMLNNPVDVVWYFHDDLGASKGTKNMVEQAANHGVPVRNGQEITAEDVCLMP